MSWNKNTIIQTLEDFSRDRKIIRSRVFAKITDFGLDAQFAETNQIDLHLVEVEGRDGLETYAQRRYQSADCDFNDYVDFVRVLDLKQPFNYDVMQYDPDYHGEIRPKPLSILLQW